jgi:hypothetical protein
MRPRSIPRFLIAPAACLLAAAGSALAACDDLAEPAEAAPAGAAAAIEAVVYATRGDPRPVEGVIMIVRGDAGSSVPFRGPRQSFVTDAAGSVRAQVLAGPRGVEAGSSTEGVIGPGGSGSAGQVCVVFLHEGTFSAPRCGLTLPVSGPTRLGAVFTEDFSAPAAEAGE